MEANAWPDEVAQAQVAFSLVVTLSVVEEVFAASCPVGAVMVTVGGVVSAPVVVAVADADAAETLPDVSTASTQ
jgi:hypothetical protein